MGKHRAHVGFCHQHWKTWLRYVSIEYIGLSLVDQLTFAFSESGIAAKLLFIEEPMLETCQHLTTSTSTTSYTFAVAMTPTS
jgi:hypothetical protein